MHTFTYKTKVIIFLTILFYGLLTVDCGLIYAQSPDPIAPELQVDGEIEIGANRSLRLKPVMGIAPASPEAGDLYFDGSVLRTWDGDSWEVIAEQGYIFYDDTTSKLYSYDSSISGWRLLASSGITGPKTVASRVVAAKDSLTGLAGADYKCNGSGDGVGDQKEINDAILEVGNRGGGAVYLLEGTYEITGPINLRTPDDSVRNVSIIGAGRSTVLQVKSGANYSVFYSYSYTTGLLISQLMIDGNNISGIKGIYFYGVTNSKIDKIWIENISGTAVYLEGYTRYNIISGNHIKGNGQGIYLSDGSENNIILDNNIKDNKNDGIYLYSSSSNVISNNKIEGNGLTGSDKNGIHLYNSPYNSISANIIKENKGAGCLLDGSSSCNLNSNIINSNTKFGVRIESNCSSTNVASNYLGGNEEGSIYCDGKYNTLFANWTYRYATTLFLPSINIKGTENLISSNYIRYIDNPYTGNPGLYLEGNSNYLVSNYVLSGTGELPAVIWDAGTNNKYTDKTKMTFEKKSLGCDIDLSQQPYSYISLVPTNDCTVSLSNADYRGALLILENSSSQYNVTIEDSGNKNLEQTRVLGYNDVLRLIWNGTVWLEIGYANNN